MSFWEGLTLAFQQIRTEKLKSFFSTLGVILGEGKRLVPEQRQDFVDRANKIFGGTEQQQDQLVSEYTRLSTFFGVDPQGVIVEQALIGQQVAQAGDVSSEGGGGGQDESIRAIFSE